MAPKNPIKDLRAAAEAAQKALADALAAGKKDAVTNIETIIKDNELTAVDLVAVITKKDEAIELLKAVVSAHHILPADLGFKATGRATSASTGSASGTARNMGKPLKSKTDAATVGVWLAHPPKFLEAEGCFETYKAGKSVDDWLVNPSDEKAKENFLAKLQKLTGQAPSKTQSAVKAKEAAAA
ncbi:hypothetical protein [Paraburkholderia fungorum]|jgi:hypothetical protein|uniref:hypothetical protein n=1 Tax=Paraburkholderia fungorum TaxID=134537 RepID=UPI000D066565|nr:hypothetical protein [Paraburkholderia fungorum]PRZ48162.1 hypothetical protein BX589_128118 [Paraburkholderia fungorum]